MVEPSFEQRQQQRKDSFRQWLAIAYIFVFLPAWFVFMLVVATNCELEIIEVLALGTANGIFLGAFKDTWQFIWRKS